MFSFYSSWLLYWKLQFDALSLTRNGSGPPIDTILTHDCCPLARVNRDFDPNLEKNNDFAL